MAYIHTYVHTYTHIYIAGMQVLKELGIEVDVYISSEIDQDAVMVSYIIYLSSATYVAYNFWDVMWFATGVMFIGCSYAWNTKR